MITKVIAQFVDLDNSQRSEPFAVEVASASETLNLLEDYLNQEVEGKRPNMGVLVVSETVQLPDSEDVDTLRISQAPIMKFEQFKKRMEQKANG